MRSNGAKPQRRDPVATRKKLLTAARREFARSGLAGARVDEIADRAGVNKQLVYHYFGDKDALYLEVGTRSKAERVHYPDVDFRMERDDTGRRWMRKSGEPIKE